MDARLEKAVTIIFLHYSTLRCLYGIIRRRIQYHGKSHPEIGEGCPERLEWAFVKWVAEFNRKKAPELLEKLSMETGNDIHILKSK
ncbi:hypothetical protein [Bacillus sp. FJAT-18017]|uniref:hypothetical protein n=1 Tax=Bacillus sp. FJAT-18017 TaxID=1705566 RepID=UPI000ACA2AA7|nr:hypothetical protein [Bacillus sp. FJAT-18017]